MMKKQEVRYVFVNPNTDKDMEQALQNIIIEKMQSLRINQTKPRADQN